MKEISLLFLIKYVYICLTHFSDQPKITLKTVPFRKISTPANQVKSRYFSRLLLPLILVLLRRVTFSFLCFSLLYTAVK